MILIGLDDTDMPGTPGTNQLARAIVRELAPQFQLVWIVRHQLLDDPRVPYTSKNGSASITLQPRDSSGGVSVVVDVCRRVMHGWFVPGSDPGLCVAPADRVSPAVTDWGHRCQQELVTRAAAQELAAAEELHLEGLGGTHGGMIGALAAVGLAREANDGRIIQWQEWPDDLCGVHPVATIRQRGIGVRDAKSGADCHAGAVDVGKHLRPNLRCGAALLFVERSEADQPMQALKFV